MKGKIFLNIGVIILFTRIDVLSQSKLHFNYTGNVFPVGIDVGFVMQRGFRVYNNYGVRLQPKDTTDIKSTINKNNNSAKNNLNDVVVFPNPANEIIYVKVKNYGNDGSEKNYELLDGNGRVILKGSAQSSFFYIDVTNVSPGYYFIKIKDNKEISTKKILIQNK